jgi:hypothetical protein
MNQPRVAPNLAAAGRELWQILHDICDPYRPELHYMRGPGPKWHAAHAPVVMPATGQLSGTAEVGA